MPLSHPNNVANHECLSSHFISSHQDEKAIAVATTLFETALVESGFVLEDPSKFASRIYSTLRGTLNIDPDAQVEEEVETEELVSESEDE